jgi:hypothetical protein
VEIGIGAAQFPEKEYINEIFVAVRMKLNLPPPRIPWSKYDPNESKS